MSDIKEDLAFLESPMRGPTEGGRRGLYEHVKNKSVWYFLYSRGLRSRIKVNVRRSADANKKKGGHPFKYINGWEGGVKNLTGAKTFPLILSLKVSIIAMNLNYARAEVAAKARQWLRLMSDDLCRQ